MIGHYQRGQARGLFDDRPDVTGKKAELAGALDITVEEDHTGGRGQKEKFTLCRRQFRACQARYDKRSELSVNISDQNWHRVISVDSFRRPA